MKPTSVTLISVALVAALAVGAAQFFAGGETRKNSGAPPSAAAAGEVPSQQPEATTEEAELADERHRQVALEIERALVSADPQQRETAFNVLLPQMIGAQPRRVIAMVSKQDPGETRDLLRDEVTRQWIRTDSEAALEWLSSLPDEAERRAGATTAVRTLAASSPARAIEVADQFGIGWGDGSLEHMVQIWATENPEEATRWIEKQPPDDPRTVQLRARIDQVRAQRQ